MAIEFHCPQCSKLLRTAEDKAGRVAKCPDCGEAVTVPGGGSPASDPYQVDPYGDESGADSRYGIDETDAFDSVIGGSTHGSRASGAKATGPMKPCPMCGEKIRAAAIRCRYCGDTFGKPQTSRSRAGNLAPHRGGLILAFSLLGWMVCAIFAPIAWVMGNSDLREIREGRMDPEGEGLTQAGRIIAMVQCIFLIVAVAIGAVVICAGVAANG